MPEVKASPATPDKSLSHSRYSLAIDIFGWKIQVLRRNLSGAWFGRLREGVSRRACGGRYRWRDF
jgi:hypothetical protein